MRLGLGSLPPPVFSRAPPGQRSVPAIEFLNKDSPPVSTNSNTPGNNGNIPSLVNNTGGLPSVLASGANTPTAGLGNGSMTTEPWNLWSDSTAPVNGCNINPVPPSPNTDTPHDEYSAIAQEAAQASINGSNNARDDNELASALAAAVVLDKNHDKRSSIASRVSSSSRSNIGGSGIVEDSNDSGRDVMQVSSWPEGLTADPTAALQSQSFALDPNASPERRAGGDGDLVSHLYSQLISYLLMLKY